MKKTAFILLWAIVALSLLNACGKKNEIVPTNNLSNNTGIRFDLKEFIGIYDAQMVNYADAYSLVVSRTEEGFNGNKVWISAKWNRVNGAKVAVELTNEQPNGDVTVVIPKQIILDSLEIEGKGTFYYYNDDFYLDIDYSLSNGAESNSFGMIAIKKVYSQNVIVNVNVDCSCECTCDGNDCDCVCDCEE
ncbi:hypothetical protein [uncultured Microscilla sp.]|uniref:hypothetical protein n=1 Tax=uncultured Microscilla sp. TaxID=432653 RepID=UPI00261FC9F6|nr:hypothetical protein [uncultured Microscilla sp.]